MRVRLEAAKARARAKVQEGQLEAELDQLTQIASEIVRDLSHSSPGGHRNGADDLEIATEIVRDLNGSPGGGGGGAGDLPRRLGSGRAKSPSVIRLLAVFFLTVHSLCSLCPIYFGLVTFNSFALIGPCSG